MIDEETSNLMQQYYNDDAFYIAADRVYQSSDDEFAGMFGPIQTVAGLYLLQYGIHMVELVRGSIQQTDSLIFAHNMR